MANIFIEVIAKMAGSRSDQLILSRPKERIFNIQETLNIQYEFTFTNSAELLSELLSDWKSICLLLHFREWNSFRDIENDCIDLYVTLNDKWDYDNYVPDCFSSEAHQFLSVLPLLSASFQKPVSSQQ